MICRLSTLPLIALILSCSPALVPADVSEASDVSLVVDVTLGQDANQTRDVTVSGDVSQRPDAGTNTGDVIATQPDVTASLPDVTASLPDVSPSLPDVAPSGLSVSEFSLVTYNVAGLPAYISPSDPVTNMPFIGPFLNDYDLALVQEDFWYHDTLNAGVDLPYRSAPELTAPTLLAMGDGLNRFSNMSIADHTRFDWNDCFGYQECENDCFTNKGFTFSTIEVGEGLFIDVYNLHMDAGTCEQDFVARRGNADQLIAEVAARSSGRAVIIAGDTNLNLRRPIDVGILDDLVASTGTQIACRVGVCQGESIDRILFRSGTDLELSVESRERPTHFLTPEGDALSDHRPTVIHFSLSQP